MIAQIRYYQIKNLLIRDPGFIGILYGLIAGLILALLTGLLQPLKNM